MKAQVNKSQLMKRAWNIFRGNNPYSYSFSDALSRAWYIEKEAIRYEQEQAEIAEMKAKNERLAKARKENNTVSESFHLGAMNYYQGTGSQNRYFGD